MIVAIDGQPITGVALHDVALRLRGEIGSDVEITLSRPGQPEPIKLKVRREAVVVPSDDFGL
jgi:carboxyl-terminal processing protease